jgi:hypothetical protein
MANRKWKMEKAWEFAISHLPFPIRPEFFSGLLDSFMECHQGAGDLACALNFPR